MKTKDLALIAVMAVIITVCSWISIPMTIPFTMQTFAVFVTLLIIGGRRGVAAIALYILLGMVGVPVFSGFQGGISHIIGPTGGYIVGFIFMGVIYMLGEKRFGQVGKIILLVVGLFVCYLVGTLWFVAIGGSDKSFWAVAIICVLPYILPDLAKLALAIFISRVISKTHITDTF